MEKENFTNPVSTFVASFDEHFIEYFEDCPETCDTIEKVNFYAKEAFDVSFASLAHEFKEYWASLVISSSVVRESGLSRMIIDMKEEWTKITQRLEKKYFECYHVHPHFFDTLKTSLFEAFRNCRVSNQELVTRFYPVTKKILLDKEPKAVTKKDKNSKRSVGSLLS